MHIPSFLKVQVWSSKVTTEKEKGGQKWHSSQPTGLNVVLRTDELSPQMVLRMNPFISKWEVHRKDGLFKKPCNLILI